MRMMTVGNQRRWIAKLVTIAFCATALSLTGCGSSPTAPAAVQRARSSKVVNLPVVGGPSTFEAVGVAQPKRPTTGTQAGGAGAAYQDTGAKPATGAGAAATGQLEAAIVTEKNGSLFGMGTYKCTVEVTNPTDHRLTGNVTVTFMNKDKPSKTEPAVRPVDVPANGAITLEFEDKKWSTDNAEVEVATNAAPPGGLVAAVIKTKNGIVFGMGKFKTTVEVTNPTGATKSGTLVVTFTNKGEPVEGSPIKQELTLDAGETQTFDFEDKHWKTDGVEADIE